MVQFFIWSKLSRLDESVFKLRLSPKKIGFYRTHNEPIHLHFLISSEFTIYRTDDSNIFNRIPNICSNFGFFSLELFYVFRIFTSNAIEYIYLAKLLELLFYQPIECQTFQMFSKRYQTFKLVSQADNVREYMISRSTCNRGIKLKRIDCKDGDISVNSFLTFNC